MQFEAGTCYRFTGPFRAPRSRVCSDPGQVVSHSGDVSFLPFSAFCPRITRISMPNSNQHVRERERLDFAKIQGSIQIPNLIEVQMKSYQRFLQMDLLPSERDD